jgi:DNA-binding IclR family transcriptional regulator
MPEKKYDVLHVGHNWWRWKQIKEQILPALDQIREEIGEIGFIGMWWDAVPEWADKLGLEPAFRWRQSLSSSRYPYSWSCRLQ